jgi:hypothetical protein
MRKGRADTLILSLLAILAGCSSFSRGASDCQDRVAAKIKREHPQSRGTSFNADSADNRRDGDRVLLSGTGQVRTKEGDRRRFTYSCVYNDRTGRVGNVQYDVQ